MQNQVRAKAQVRLVVEVEGGAPFGGDFTLQNVYNLAVKSALEEINSIIRQDQKHRIKIIGEPKVIGVVTSIE